MFSFAHYHRSFRLPSVSTPAQPLLRAAQNRKGNIIIKRTSKGEKESGGSVGS